MSHFDWRGLVISTSRLLPFISLSYQIQCIIAKLKRMVVVMIHTVSLLKNTEAVTLIISRKKAIPGVWRCVQCDKNVNNNVSSLCERLSQGPSSKCHSSSTKTSCKHICLAVEWFENENSSAGFSSELTPFHRFLMFWKYDPGFVFLSWKPRNWSHHVTKRSSLARIISTQT